MKLEWAVYTIVRYAGPILPPRAGFQFGLVGYGDEWIGAGWARGQSFSF